VVGKLLLNRVDGARLCMIEALDMLIGWNVTRFNKIEKALELVEREDYLGDPRDHAGHAIGSQIRRSARIHRSLPSQGA